MPELPELHGMSTVINEHAKGRTFMKCSKSAVSKLPTVRPPASCFTISAQSRGKELMMRLQPAASSAEKAVYILCNMGMTGFFEAAASAKEVHKHAHLRFYATDGTVLSFVDQRRFGTWRCLDQPHWPADRGPCPVMEYEAFRRGVVSAVAAKPDTFASKPICQVLHDQTIFNGIGNYLRAEVLHRAGVQPFAPAKAVLANLPEVLKSGGRQDLLAFCRDVPREVIDMNLSKYQGGAAAAATDTDSEHSRWRKWLRVYGHDDASWAVDKEGRRIWFRGPPGKLFGKFAEKSHLRSKGATGKKRLAAEVAKEKKVQKKDPPKRRGTQKAILKRPSASASRLRGR
eukprot:gnl/TRDRNA2_/TRDRNA2_184482_c0_seq1.p1 gnl/TRDRNA2_/TRDRNA2_184482_c0~~gnl/TRDRNA2_/TRDRNA2_184482_c0_seq1.p1  ORF type:complete len:343 (-),score=66.35 gnl/TRDRNA2_/TRDRNA2_184482_c0_seq1:106-1134(-)